MKILIRQGKELPIVDKSWQIVGSIRQCWGAGTVVVASLLARFPKPGGKGRVEETWEKRVRKKQKKK